MNDKKNKKPLREWLRCPNCQWTYFTYRKKFGDYLCRHCGASFTANWNEHYTELKQLPIFNHRKEKR